VRDPAAVLLLGGGHELSLPGIQGRAGRHPQVGYLDLMEVSPPLDLDGRTAHLAASILYALLQGLAER
jgi:arginase family enzyme